jgi:hypothetical protein
MLAAAMAGCVAAPASDGAHHLSQRLVGQWGGDGANVVAREDGVTIELPCAVGRIDGEVPLDRRNEFDVAGTLRAFGGARPSPESGAVAPRPVRFRGRITGERLALTIVSPDAAVREFTLQQGAEARVPLCP